MIEIYTDGSCSQVKGTGRGPGGWAVIFLDGEEEERQSGGEPNTTNQRMELLAAIKALSYLGKTPCQVRLHSDSAYLVNCFRDKWYLGWRNRTPSWTNSQGKPVVNRDLWEELIALYEIHEVEFVKVKGHANDTRNNQCDKLARAACEAQKKVTDDIDPCH